MGCLDAKFTTLTLLPHYDPQDEILVAIMDDLGQCDSVLGLLNRYMEDLKGCADSEAPAMNKLAKLFELAIVPDRILGFHYGATLCMKTGDQVEGIAKWGNIINFIWGNTLVDISPWAGKSFTPADSDQIGKVTDSFFKPDGEAYLGINAFHIVEDSVLSSVSLHAMDLWMGLKRAPKDEAEKYGYEKKGGDFITYRAPTVDAAGDREVLQLNYRWKRLECRPPLSLLIDELLQIADGLYLGQLFFATNHVLGDYDPEKPIDYYDYRHFGYFTLFDESWNDEARRLFSFVQIPK